MRARVVYDTNYGNTRIIAEVIARELGREASILSVADVTETSLDGVDVLVVGTIDRATLQTIESQVQETVRKDINITRAPQDWQTIDDPFYATIRARPLVSIPLTGPDSAALS